MRITFQTENTNSVQQTAAEQTRPGMGRTENTGAVKEGAFFSKSDKILGGSGKKSSMQIQQEAQLQDASAWQDYMTVMSHTMSAEDFARLGEEGFRFENLDPEEAVTILDKIKAELARSGQHIVGYTDDLNMDTLAAALGSDSLARAVSRSFEEADVPLTDENIESVKHAWDMASQLLPMTHGTRKYLVDNGMEPEIRNVYLAQSSGARGNVPETVRYYAQDVKGYYAASADKSGSLLQNPRRLQERNTEGGSPQEQSLQQQRLQTQVDKIIQKAGLPVDEKSRSMGAFLLEQGLPLTEENLLRLEELQAAELPVSEEMFAQAAANALAMGREAACGRLVRTENIYEKAQRVLDYYQTTELPAEADSLAARRQLEEIRLRMTAEVNVKLLKSGFAIDTAPMEQLVAALREAEEQLAKQYFPGDGQAVEKLRSYQNTTNILKELPGLPARILGLPASQGDFAGFYETGKALQASYEKAQESYETLMTAPRADLGDSIRKAFANVDEILKDMGMEPDDENQRAVRILGYNRMQITEENVERVREADARVRLVMQKMTPASTLRMIRDGVNPLEKTFSELISYFENLPEDYQEKAESYSRFLYGLEKNRQITEEERESYMGIYRLLRQIEKSDGAAVGALVNSGAQLHLKNLLSAVRSGRFKTMDVRVSDRLGGVSERIWNGERISDQIARAFAQDMEDALYNAEATEEYRQRELSQLRKTVYTEEECLSLLQKGEIPQSAENLLAAQTLLRENTVFSQRRKERFRNLQEIMEKNAELWEKLDDREAFVQDFGREIQNAADAVENITWEAKKEVDVRELRLMHKQLSVAEQLARREEYFLPVYINGELTGVRLTLETGKAEKGRVHIAWSASEEAYIEGDFELLGNHMTAVFSGNYEAEVTKLQNIADTFTEQAKKYWVVDQVNIIKNAGAAKTVNTGQRSSGVQSLREENTAAVMEKPDNAELYRAAKVFLQAVKEQERGSL